MKRREALETMSAFAGFLLVDPLKAVTTLEAMGGVEKEKSMEFAELKKNVIKKLNEFSQLVLDEERQKIDDQIELLTSNNLLRLQLERSSEELEKNPDKFELQLEEEESDQKKFHQIKPELITLANFAQGEQKDKALDTILEFMNYNAKTFLECDLPAQTRERDIWRLKKEIIFELLKEGDVIKQAALKLENKIKDDMHNIQEWLEKKIDGILGVIFNLPHFVTNKNWDKIKNLHINEIISDVKDAFLNLDHDKESVNIEQKEQVDGRLNKILSEVKTTMIYPMDAFGSLSNYAMCLKILFSQGKIDENKKKELLKPLEKSIRYFENSLKKTDGLFVRFYMSDGDMGSDQVAPDDSLAKPLEFLSLIGGYLDDIQEPGLAEQVRNMVVSVWQTADQKLLNQGELGLKDKPLKPVNFSTGHSTVEDGKINRNKNTKDWPADGSRIINARLTYIGWLIKQNNIQEAEIQTLRAMRELRFVVRSAALTAKEPIYDIMTLKRMDEDQETNQKYQKYQKDGRLIQTWFWVETDDEKINPRRCLNKNQDETSHREWSNALTASMCFLENKDRWAGFDQKIKDELTEIYQEVKKFAWILFEDLMDLGKYNIKKLPAPEKSDYIQRITDALIQTSNVAFNNINDKISLDIGKPYIIP